MANDKTCNDVWLDENSECPGCYALAGENHRKGCDWKGGELETLTDEERADLQAEYDKYWGPPLEFPLP